jgi:hypothetical protein
MRDFVLRRASEFSKVEIARFESIVKDAGEVSANAINGLLAHNPLLLFYPNTNEIQAVGALKIPNEGYRERIFKEKACVDIENIENLEELGWIVSLNPGQGIGSFVTEQLALSGKSIYATVREENKSIKGILLKNGFTQEGKAYNSERGDYKLLLFVKQDAQAGTK